MRVYPHVLRKEPGKRLEEAAVEFPVTVLERTHQQGQAYYEADRLFRVAVHERSHRVKFRLAKEQNIPAVRVQSVYAA
jgi:hypothetical protein